MALASLSTLAHLDLSEQVDVTDVGFAALAALPQLQVSASVPPITKCMQTFHHQVHATLSSPVHSTPGGRIVCTILCTSHIPLPLHRVILSCHTS